MTLAPSPILAIPAMEPEQDTANVTLNEAVASLEAFTQLSVKDRDLTAPPGSPANGDRYLVAASPTGAWAGWAGRIADYLNGQWKSFVPREGWIAWIDDEDFAVRYDGSAWVGIPACSFAHNLSASATQTQGQVPLTREVNHVGTVAAANNAVTAPAAFAGARFTVINAGANALQLFPASGDKFGTGSLNASVSVATTKTVTYYATDATTWWTQLGA